MVWDVGVLNLLQKKWSDVVFVLRCISKMARRDRVYLFAVILFAIMLIPLFSFIFESQKSVPIAENGQLEVGSFDRYQNFIDLKTDLIDEFGWRLQESSGIAEETNCERTASYFSTVEVGSFKEQDLLEMRRFVERYFAQIGVGSYEFSAALDKQVEARCDEEGLSMRLSHSGDSLCIEFEMR